MSSVPSRFGPGTPETVSEQVVANWLQSRNITKSAKQDDYLKHADIWYTDGGRIMVIPRAVNGTYPKRIFDDLERAWLAIETAA